MKSQRWDAVNYGLMAKPNFPHQFWHRQAKMVSDSREDIAKRADRHRICCGDDDPVPTGPIRFEFDVAALLGNPAVPES